jgi:phosphoribosyl 1,2-cyclic phosphate phosphodiesterase
MKLTFLGTAASEGYPDAFCACDRCEQARRLGGPSLRKRSAALINDDLLIDLGPDLMAAAQQHGLSLAGLRYCLQTHEHEDHLDPAHLVSRSEYCGVYGAPQLHYHATQGAFAKITSRLGRRVEERGLFDPEVSARLNVSFQVIEPFEQFALGPYRITSLAANHAPELTALLYVIEQEGRTLFYATDTGEIPAATWQALCDHGFRFNVVAMDHTFGLAARSTGHMNWQQFVEQVARLQAEGLLANDARVYAHHIAHHSNPPHPELVAFAAQQGYAVAYDGLVIDV